MFIYTIPYSIFQATHKEVVQLISGRDSVRLKVRSAGVIPVKHTRTEPVSWQMVGEKSREELMVRGGEDPEVNVVHRSEEMECPERRLYITMQGQHGLGCSICKVINPKFLCCLIWPPLNINFRITHFTIS